MMDRLVLVQVRDADMCTACGTSADPETPAPMLVFRLDGIYDRVCSHCAALMMSAAAMVVGASAAGQQN